MKDGRHHFHDIALKLLNERHDLVALVRRYYVPGGDTTDIDALSPTERQDFYIDLDTEVGRFAYRTAQTLGLVGPTMSTSCFKMDFVNLLEEAHNRGELNKYLNINSERGH